MSFDHHEFELLYSKWTDQTIDADEYERFCDLLRNSDECRDMFCDIRMDDRLIEHAVRKLAATNKFLATSKYPISGTLSGFWANRHIGKLGILTSATLLAFISLVFWANFFSIRNADTEQESFGKVVRLNNVHWADRKANVKEWSLLRSGEQLRFESGSIEITFDAGVQLIVEGPAEMDVVAAKRIRVAKGKFIARVNSNGSGFAIETPSGVIVDQGTEFGLDVAPEGEVKVIVFQGMVDVYHQQDPKNPQEFSTSTKPISLGTGEGMLFCTNGESEPVLSIKSDYFLRAALDRPPVAPQAQPLITGVRDNVRDVQAKKFYEIVPRGFGEDARAFVDRSHEWNGLTSDGLPDFLIGGDMIRTFNMDKYLDDFQMTVTVSFQARFFVLLDRRSVVPDWLERDFMKTPYLVGLDEGVSPEYYEGQYDYLKRNTPEERIPANLTQNRLNATGPGNSIDNIFTVWERKSTEPGKVVLGGISRQIDGNRNLQCFYGIVAVPFFSK